MHIKRPMAEEVAMALANTHTCIIQYGSQRWWENSRLCAPVISTDNGAAFTGRVFIRRSVQSGDRQWPLSSLAEVRSIINDDCVRAVNLIPLLNQMQWNRYHHHVHRRHLCYELWAASNHLLPALLLLLPYPLFLYYVPTNACRKHSCCTLFVQKTIIVVYSFSYVGSSSSLDPGQKDQFSPFCLNDH